MTAFSAELKRAMTTRRMTRPDIVKATGACSTLAKRWIDGDAYPDHDTVVVLGEALHWPSLVARSIEDRTGTCVACGGPTFTTRGSRRPRFCGPVCTRRVADRVRNGRRKQHSLGVVTSQRDRLREAVEAFCRDCEPEGICRDEECRLRGVSPLPYIPLSKVTRRVA